MYRRDFLCLRTEHARRIAQLSCEALYMHYQHATVTAAPAQQDGDARAFELGDDEPPTEFATRTTEALFADVQRSLANVDVLRIVDSSWLTVEPREFSRDVEALVATFRRRGGTVEYGDAATAGNRTSFR